MALDSRQKRAAVIGVGRAWYRNPHPSSMDAAQRASVGAVYPVAAFSGVISPVFSGPIPNVSITQHTGTHQYDYSTYFTGADSYSISPVVEDGWTFNTSTGVLTVDTDVPGIYGRYVVTATNAGGTDDSNSFAIRVEVSYAGGGKPRRGTRALRPLEEYEEEVKRLLEKEKKEKEAEAREIEAKLAKAKQKQVETDKKRQKPTPKLIQKQNETELRILILEDALAKVKQEALDVARKGQELELTLHEDVLLLLLIVS